MDIHSEWKEFSTHELVSLDKLKVDATNLVQPAQKVLQCSRHPAKELDLYCETCQEVICRDCILKAHRDHQYDLATDAFPQQKEVLVSSIRPAEQQLASVNKALEDLESLCGEISSQRQALEAKIREEIRLSHQTLQEREQVLISQLNQLTQQKLKNVAAQQDQLQTVAVRLQSCCGFLQESLRAGSQVEILAMARSFVQQVKDMTASLKSESLEPEERASLVFFRSQEELRQACEQFGEITTSDICPDKCYAAGDGLKLAVIGEEATATVTVVDQNGRECQHPVNISCELVSSDGSSRVRGEAAQANQSQYKISYLPQYRGPQQLHIRIRGRHIAGSPFSLSVITTKPTNVITGVQGPWGLTLNQGKIMVVENGGNCLSVLSENGGKERSFGTHSSGPGQLRAPCGVALSAAGDILVGDQHNHCIQVFSFSGQSMRCVGTKGNGPLQFSCPIDIAIHPHSKKIYVTDNSNHRVQILNEDLTFSSCFGSEDSGNRLKGLRGITFSTAGDVYVCEANNHRVKVFTANGVYIRQFGKEGKGRGELIAPRGIALDSNDLVYISDWGNHRVSIFTQEGNFLRSFGCHGSVPGKLNSPSGITVSQNGVIYVSDFMNDCVQIF